VAVRYNEIVRDLDELFSALARSSRGRYRLGLREIAYLQTKGLESVLVQAAECW
jgi:hypothetical protein